jgi:hypothetical protein
MQGLDYDSNFIELWFSLCKSFFCEAKIKINTEVIEMVDIKACIKFLLTFAADILYFYFVLNYTSIPGGKGVETIFLIASIAIFIGILFVAMHISGLIQIKLNNNFKPQ